MKIRKDSVLNNESLVSIITSTYNKAKYLELTLAGFVCQTYKNFEIVVVDDGSTDDTQKIIKEYADKINIVYFRQENQGIASARNTALKLARGDYIIVIDDDRIPCPEFVYEHKRQLDINEKVLCIGKEGNVLSVFREGVILDFNNKIKIFQEYPILQEVKYYELLNADDIIKDFQYAIRRCFLEYTSNSLQMEEYEKNFAEFYFAWSRAYGGNISFRRSMCKEEIYYDTQYVGYGMEDIDFSYQFYLQGFKYIYVEKAVNYHQEHPRGADEGRSMYKNVSYFFKKYQTLETILLKMDWENKLTFNDVNSFLKILCKFYDTLEEAIKEFGKRGG